MRQFFFYLEYFIFRAIAGLVNLLPFKAADRLAETAGRLIFHLISSRRNIALNNLKAAFTDEKPDDELRRIAMASMQNMVKLAIEIARIPYFAKNPANYFKSTGKENVQTALNRGKGLVFLISHYSNWELLAMSGLSCGQTVHSVARPLKNPCVYEYIKHLRRLENVESVDKGGAVRETLKLIKAKKVVAILIDQHERQGSVWVDFFGRPAATSSFVAMLAHRYDVPVIPVYLDRHHMGSYTARAGKEFPVIRTGNYERDLILNTQQYIRNLEEEIRKAPADWLWMHRRWRQAPQMTENVIKEK